MDVSVFTPSHNPRFLDDCYQSLRDQTMTSWKWTVVLSAAALEWVAPEDDPRVSIHRVGSDFPVGVVGAAKRYACDLATGDVLVELDHDDVLLPTCLEDVCAGFTEHPEATMAFSDSAFMADDRGPVLGTAYDEAQGWRFKLEKIGGVEYERCLSLEPSPHNVGYIWYSPNHVRAFRRDAYEAAGGYDENAQVLDDQTLMMRLYQAGDFHHIDRCLYLQRLHDENTWRVPRLNKFIQEQTVVHYRENCEALFRAWSWRRGLATATVVSGASHAMVGPDVWDAVTLEPGVNSWLPFDDGTVGLIVCNDVLQRIHDRAWFFNECYRVLAHGGAVLSRTPSTDGRGAFQDPSHVAFYNENSFWYLTEAKLRPCIPGLHARFQAGHLSTYFPTDWHRERNISYVVANLLAVKDGPRQGGLLLS